MFSKKRQFGNIGEDLTCKFLMKQGFEILERNFLRKCGEIDIVCQKGNVLHFVEVKTVSCELVHTPGAAVTHVTTGGEYRPEDNVHPAKLKSLARTIQVYLVNKNVAPWPSKPVAGRHETEWVLDVACVYLDLKRKEVKVKMLENIVI
ncbi:MAG: YraN family protein [Candidatus Paceibacterota bacterium]|jgi:Holliday junction resolvase-like predicted endonuclease